MACVFHTVALATVLFCVLCSGDARRRTHATSTTHQHSVHPSQVSLTKPDVDGLNDQPVDCSKRTRKGDVVTIHYEATQKWSADVVSSTWKRGKPIQFVLNAGMHYFRFVPSWFINHIEESILGMCVGEVRRFMLTIANSERVGHDMRRGVKLLIVVELLEIGAPLNPAAAVQELHVDNTPFPPNGHVRPATAELLADGANEATFQRYLLRNKDVRFVDIFVHTRDAIPMPRAIRLFDVEINDSGETNWRDGIVKNGSLSAFVWTGNGERDIPQVEKDAIHKFLEEHPEKHTVVMGCGDRHLVAEEGDATDGPFYDIAANFKGHRCFWEGMNAKVPWVRVMPIGYTPRYEWFVEMDSVYDMLMKGIDYEKKKGVLAAWGLIYVFIEDRRKEAHEWVKNTPWMNRTEVPRNRWHKTLSEYRFMLSPTGNGIQSPKIMEAILVGTIPILQHEEGFYDLQRMGYPVVVVEHWNEITPEKLDQWWIELSPLLPTARWMIASEVWFAFMTREPFIENIHEFLATFQTGPPKHKVDYLTLRDQKRKEMSRMITTNKNGLNDLLHDRAKA